MLIFLCALACALSILPANAETDIREILDAAFAKKHTLGASVAVIQNGEITFTHTYGTRCPEGESITEDTVFQVGSISKMIANIGLMQLLEEKQIPLDAEIGDVLGFSIRHPLYPNDRVTIRQLMTHTSSLRDNREYYRALEGRGKKLSVLFEKRRGILFHPEWKPGKQREYTNFGGGLIGTLIEKLSGETLDDYMKERVFDPLDITASFQISRIPANVPAADIYRMPDGEVGKILRDETIRLTEPNPEEHYCLTAGKLIISAPDLAKMLIALCDGGVYHDARILRESAVAEMLTPQDDRESVRCKTGNGLFMNILKDAQVEGRTLYGHGGRAYGMLCAAYFDPTDRTGVVMLTNGCNDHNASTGVGALGREILTLCYEHIIDPTHEVKNPFAVE